MGIQILEVSHVTPSPGDAVEQILPLLHFDIAWIPMLPSESVYFFDYNHSESHFLDTLVPNLKKSLSLALKHFLPLAGKIVFPLSSGLPFSHYIAWEDFVPLTISVSNSDFFHLTTNNHPKGVVELHELVSPLPDVVRSPSSIEFSVLALRVTLFPSRGVCIGITNHHAVCDAITLLGPSGFLQAWASIAKLNGDSHFEKFLPSYDRSTVHGARAMTTSFWNHVRLSEPVVRPTVPLLACNLRVTFELSLVEIQCLKNILLSQEPALGQVSSYVAVTAHVWSCLAQSAAAGRENVDEDEDEYLSVSVDCRGRLTPPLPATYFGNCLIFILARSTHGQLKGRAGFPRAALAIASAIQGIVKNERGVMARAEEEYLLRKELAGKRLIGVSGPHQVDQSSVVDFGWGGLRKLEALHIDYNEGVSLIKSKQGFEVGLSMPKPKMDAFAAFFKKNLSITSNM